MTFKLATANTNENANEKKEKSEKEAPQQQQNQQTLSRTKSSTQLIGNKSESNADQSSSRHSKELDKIDIVQIDEAKQATNNDARLFSIDFNLEINNR